MMVAALQAQAFVGACLMVFFLCRESSPCASLATGRVPKVNHVVRSGDVAGLILWFMSTSPGGADIAALRKSYERAELDEAASDADPLRQFDKWLGQAIAAQVPEPNAMTLATVGASGQPSTRVVLIKGYDTRGIVWYTNYESRKGRELAEQPARCAAVPLGRARARGPHRRPRRARPAPRKPTPTTPRARSTAASAPGRRRKARLSAHARCWWPTPPRRRPNTACKPPRPPHWGGYRLVPESLGVLAGPQEPAARPAALSPRRQRLGARAPRAVVPRRNAADDAVQARCFTRAAKVFLNLATFGPTTAAQ